MKKLHTLLIALLFAAFMAASFGSKAGTIISAQDGSWKDGTTWVGNVVPNAADSVVVQHVVDIYNEDSCMHLYVMPSGTIQNKYNATRTLVVMGNLWVDGTATYSNNYFYIRLGGDLYLNGIWTGPRLYFIGSAEQVISATPGKVFDATHSNIIFEDLDPVSPLKLATDITFIDIELVCNASTVEFAPGIEVAFYTEPLRNANIIGNNSGLMMRNGAFVEDCFIDNLTFRGEFNVGDNIILSGEIINADTLQNLINASRVLTVNGYFTNNGTIRITNNQFNFIFNGNVTNTGLWTCRWINFEGTTDQHVSFAPETYIDCYEIKDLDVDSKIILDSDWEIHRAIINLDSAIIDVSENKLTLRQNSYIRDAVIHQALLSGTFSCFTGCVFTGETVVVDTLQKNNFNSQIPITFEGNLINNGIIRRINSYALKLTLDADFEINGPVDVEDLIFAGATDQTIYTTAKGVVIDVDQVYDTDPASNLILGSDVTFIGAEIDLAGATLSLENGNLEMQGGRLKNGSLVSDNMYIKQSGNARFENMQVSNTRLMGTCMVFGNDNIFNNITVEDTLQNYIANANPYLMVTGDFVNNGVITNSNYYKIDLYVDGNFYSYGSVVLKKCEFTGAGDQEFSSAVLPFLNTPFASSKTGGSVIAVDDILLQGCNVNLNWDVLDLQEANIITTGGKLTDVNIEGNGNKLITDGGGYIENVTIEELFLEGKLYVRGQNNTFENITVTDTLYKSYSHNSWVHITTTGNFINNGIISNEENYGIYFYVEDVVINNGHWDSKKLIFTGTDMHYIESQNANPFEVEDITNPAKGGGVEILSDLYLLNTTIDFDGVGLHIPAAGILNMDNCTLNQLSVTCGDFATINCMNNSLISNSTIDGAIISGAVDVATNTFIDCVIDGLVQNHNANAHYTLSLEGNTTNNGSLINRPSWGYKLYNDIFGNVYNNGTWEIKQSCWKGTLDQDIYLINDSSINTPSEFHAMLGTGGYQWYKNDVMIDGETSNELDFADITVADRGYYNCETDSGVSRTIRICTVIDIDLADEAYFCQYESVMIEATALTGEGPYTYSWSPVEGLSDPNISNPLANPAEPTVYFVTITDAIGCTGEAGIFVQQYPQLYVDAGADDEICFGDYTFLTGNASGGELQYNYMWTPTDGLSNPNIAGPAASPGQTTTYTLTVTDGNGCMESDQVTLTVNPLPIAYQLTLGGHFCEGVQAAIVEVANSDAGINYYLMRDGNYTGEILAGTGSFLEFYSAPVAGIYTVMGINTSTDCQNLMTGSIPVEIDYAPVIISQPGDDHRLVGTSKTFIVNVTGTEPITYSWYFEGDLLQSGPSNTYTKFNLTLEDSGEYWCNIENYCGYIQSEIMILTVIDQQSVIIPAGWSGISTYLNIWDDEVIKIFQYIGSELIIVNDFEHVYWPGQSINTYEDGKWDTYTGAQIKLSAEATVDFQGLHLEERAIELGAGWYYLPVLDHCPVAAADIFDQISSQLDIAKDIAGTRVYWPDYGITTLNTLDPGLAYLIKLNAPGTIQYSNCLKVDVPQANELRPQNTSPWSDPVYSNTSHVIALPKNVAASALMPGDWLGIFNADGTCCGIIEYDGNSTAITAFGDDPTTNQIDGLAENEWMGFRAYRVSTGETFDLVPEFDAAAGETGYFTGNGISVITRLKTEATGIGDDGKNLINIYPNPTNGMLFIEGVSAGSQIEISDATGQIVYRAEASNKCNIDLGNQASGLYSVRITNQKYTIIRKVMVE